jgi:hypothetical protein
MKQLVFTAKDDRGNAYKGGRAAASWRESDVDCRGEARLTPSIDPRAMRLTIRIEELVALEVNGQRAIVMGEDGRPFPSTESPELGPWEFEVAL